MPPTRKRSGAPSKTSAVSKSAAPQQSGGQATGLFADYRGSLVKPGGPSVGECPPYLPPLRQIEAEKVRLSRDSRDRPGKI